MKRCEYEDVATGVRCRQNATMILLSPDLRTALPMCAEHAADEVARFEKALGEKWETMPYFER